MYLSKLPNLFVQIVKWISLKIIVFFVVIVDVVGIVDIMGINVFKEIYL